MLKSSSQTPIGQKKAVSLVYFAFADIGDGDDDNDGGDGKGEGKGFPLEAWEKLVAEITDRRYQLTNEAARNIFFMEDPDITGYVHIEGFYRMIGSICARITFKKGKETAKVRSVSTATALNVVNQLLREEGEDEDEDEDEDDLKDSVKQERKVSSSEYSGSVPPLNEERNSAAPNTPEALERPRPKTMTALSIGMSPSGQDSGEPPLRSKRTSVAAQVFGVVSSGSSEALTELGEEKYATNPLHDGEVDGDTHDFASRAAVEVPHEDNAPTNTRMRAQTWVVETAIGRGWLPLWHLPYRHYCQKELKTRRLFLVPKAGTNRHFPIRTFYAHEKSISQQC